MSQNAPSLQLDQLLKLAGVAATGGHAKLLIQSGEALVNGDIETRRKRKVTVGDVVEVAGQVIRPEEFLEEEG